MEHSEFWSRAEKAMEEVNLLVDRFFGQKPQLDQFYDSWLGPGWEADQTPPFVTFTIYNINARPISCPICGKDDKWVKGGHDRAGDLGKIFVCDHGPVEYFPMIRNRATQPIISSMGDILVIRWEENEI